MAKKKKTYSSSEKKSFRKGFLLGLFTSKKKKVSHNAKKHSFSSVDQIPLNNQHNVLFSDDRYRSIREQLLFSGRYDGDPGSKDLMKDSVALYKSRYGDSYLRKHYGIKK